MAQASVRQTEMTVNVNALLTLLLAATSATTDPALKSAYTRVRKHLLNGRAFRFAGDVLTVQSGSNPHLEHSCTLQDCDCETQRGICWHRALISVLMAYQTLAAAQTVLLTPAAAPVPAPTTVDDADPFPFSGPSAYGRRVSTGRGYVRADRIGA